MAIGVHMKEFLNATSIFVYAFPCKLYTSTFWIQHFISICFQSLYKAVNQCHLPPICVSLNNRVGTDTIFTLSKLLRMGKVQSSTWLSCRTAPKYMFHLWMTCPELFNSKSYPIDKLHNVLLTDKQPTIIDYQEF